MKTKTVLAKAVEPGHKIPFEYKLDTMEGVVLDTVKSVDSDGQFVTIRFETECGITPLSIVKRIDDKITILDTQERMREY